MRNERRTHTDALAARITRDAIRWRARDLQVTLPHGLSLAPLESSVIALLFAVAADLAAPVLGHAVPPDGSVNVPTTPLLMAPNDEAASHELRGPGGLIVDVSTEAIFLGDGAPALRLRPAAALTPNAVWALVADDVVVTTFTTGDGDDDDAPAGVSVDTGDGEESGGTVPAVAVSFAVSADEAVDVVSVDGSLFVLDDGSFRLSSERKRDVSLDVTALDRAGNVADPVAVDVAFCIERPSDGFRYGDLACDDGGCASTPTSTLSLLALSSLALVNFRRRAANFRRSAAQRNPR